MTVLPNAIKLDYDMFSILRDNVDPIKIAVELQSGIILEDDGEIVVYKQGFGNRLD